MRRFTFARRIHHAVFHESRGGRAAEIASWSNAASALAVGGVTAALLWPFFAGHAVWIGLAASALSFVGLRLSLAHRFTVWIAAVIGTLTITALGGSLAWLFAHVIEAPSAPPIAGAVGAVMAALLPAWSYGQLARRRASDVPDSLIDPVSAPHSR